MVRLRGGLTALLLVATVLNGQKVVLEEAGAVFVSDGDKSRYATGDEVRQSAAFYPMSAVGPASAFYPMSVA